MPLEVSVVTPERELWSGEANFIVARAAGGDIGVLPGHAPFLGALHHASLKIEDTNGGTEFFAVHGGFIEVFEDRVTVLTPVAEGAHEIDIERARRELAEYEASLRNEFDEEIQLALLRAQARLRTAGEAGLIVG
jgi:F-type H+-transporting ATPase subunit epsilon